jgi:hypothetical protein
VDRTHELTAEFNDLTRADLHVKKTPADAVSSLDRLHAQAGTPRRRASTSPESPAPMARTLIGRSGRLTISRVRNPKV